MKENVNKFDKNENADIDENGDVQSCPRVKMPSKGELIGVVLQRLGGNRMEVKCSDGKIRNCRVPGRFKRTMWIRQNDYVIVRLWEFDNERADIVFQYNSSAVSQLKKRGLLDSFEEN